MSEQHDGTIMGRIKHYRARVTAILALAAAALAEWAGIIDAISQSLGGGQ